MFYFAIARSEPGADFLRIVIERTHSAAVGDAAGLVDDVETLGPGGVCVIGGVGHVVDAEGKSEVVAFREVIADGDALFERFRLRVADVLLYVGFHLPLVGGMGFANIDGQKIGVVFVVVKDLDDVANLATKGRSSKTAEDENKRLAGGAFANVEAVGAVERDEAGVWGGVADFQSTAMHVGQRVADHVERVFRAAGHHAKADESEDHERAEADADPHEYLLLPHEGKLLAQLPILDTKPHPGG